MSGGEEQDDAQKTEDPTAKKLEESRKKGQIPMSREINNWGMLCAVTILIATLSPHIFTGMFSILKSFFEHAHARPSMPGGIGTLLGDSTIETLKVLAFPMFVLFLAAFFSPFLQVGPLFAPESIKPSLEKISPIKGVKRLFSMRSIMEFVKGILKISIIGVVGVIILYPYFDKFEHLIGLPVPLILDELKILVKAIKL